MLHQDSKSLISKSCDITPVDFAPQRIRPRHHSSSQPSPTPLMQFQYLRATLPLLQRPIPRATTRYNFKAIQRPKRTFAMAQHGHSAACCSIPPIVSSGYKQRGEYTKIGGLNTCISYSLFINCTLRLTISIFQTSPAPPTRPKPSSISLTSSATSRNPSKAPISSPPQTTTPNTKYSCPISSRALPPTLAGTHPTRTKKGKSSGISSKRPARPPRPLLVSPTLSSRSRHTILISKALESWVSVGEARS